MGYLGFYFQVQLRQGHIILPQGAVTATVRYFRELACLQEPIIYQLSAISNQHRTQAWMIVVHYTLLCSLRKHLSLHQIRDRNFPTTRTRLHVASRALSYLLLSSCGQPCDPRPPHHQTELYFSVPSSLWIPTTITITCHRAAIVVKTPTFLDHVCHLRAHYIQPISQAIRTQSFRPSQILSKSLPIQHTSNEASRA